MGKRKPGTDDPGTNTLIRHNRNTLLKAAWTLEIMSKRKAPEFYAFSSKPSTQAIVRLAAEVGLDQLIEKYANGERPPWED